jgi:hypothetical protein
MIYNIFICVCERWIFDCKQRIFNYLGGEVAFEYREE